jgi:GTP-binding protein EngB required for normal cell division
MDLKSFREDKLKMSQSDFAVKIGEKQSDVSLWEKNGEIPLKVLEKIAQKTGADYNTLFKYKKPKPEPIKVDNTWLKAEFTKDTLSDYISKALAKLDLTDKQREEYIDDLRSLVNDNLVKPQIIIVGRSDTGKSTLINALLGADKMPASWTPTTSIAVYIKHIDDKPKFIKEDVWVFSNRVGEEDLWNERRLNDKEYCQQWKIGAGGVDTLRSFGTRQGEDYNKQAGSAVMFVDAPILSNCDIVDLPGYGTGTESDDDITFKATQRVVVIIYLSLANAFMRIEDINYLKSNISRLPILERKGGNALKPLSNLFVVASQANNVNSGNPKELDTILEKGCSELLKALTPTYWDNRKRTSGYTGDRYGKDELLSRFFVYTTDIPDLCKSFNDSLKTVSEILPIVINDRVRQFVSEYVKSRKPNLQKELEKYEAMVAEREKCKTLLKEIEKNEPARARDNDKRKEEIRSAIENFRETSIREFGKYCSENINIDAIAKLIKTKKIRNEKKDVELFGSLLQTMIQEKCGTILAEKSEKLSKKTEDYISAFSGSVGEYFEKSSFRADFDAGWAFASALSKVGMIGGLTGFLGGVAAFALGSASFILGVGGTVAAIAAVLGPIGFAIGTLITLTLGAISLFGGGWEKNVAKGLVKAFEKNDVEGKFRDGICKYWEQTKSAFNFAAQGLDTDWKNYVKGLDTLASHDIYDIKRKIASLKSLILFFDGIPL